MDFISRYGKFYNGEGEFKRRFDIFSDNYKFVRSHSNTNYTLELNFFADLTFEEFSSIYKGLRQGLDEPHETFKPSTLKAPAERVDWRDSAVTSVKSQGMCGSCWVFSTVGAVEGSHFVASGELVDLSAQQVMDCTREMNMGCNGGGLEEAF